MSQPTKPPRRQLALNLGPEIAAPARVPASPVLLQALADLLLGTHPARPTVGSVFFRLNLAHFIE